MEKCILSRSFLVREFFSKNFLVVILVFSLVVSFSIVFAFHIHDVIGGGNAWKQGDWLINNHSGFVRRGVLGSFFLFFSDVSHVNPIYIVGAFQIFAVCIFYSCMIVVGISFKKNDAVIYFLMCPLFLFFWSNDPVGSMRKEILAYLSFLPLIILSLKSDFSGHLFRYVVISLVVFFLSVLGHEANVLFAPIHVAMLYVLMRKTSTEFFLYSISYFAISAIGFIYLFTTTAIDDYMLVCDQVLNRGVGPEVCDGAMRWLSKDSGDAIAMSYDLIDKRGMVSFLFSYFMIAVFFVYILRKVIGFWKSLVFFFSSLIPFIPLYFVAIDWGRWMNFHIVSMVMMVILFFAKQDNCKVVFSNMERFVLFVFCFSWGVSHVGGYFSIDNGYLGRVVTMTVYFVELW